MGMRLKRCYRTLLTLSLVLQAISCASGQKAITSVPLRERIPPADPSRYLGVKDYTQWKNPYLVVKAEGIEIVGSTKAEQSIAVERIPAILGELPRSAWPYGLIVAIQENGVRAATDTPRINANRDKLLRLLKDMGVGVSLWPMG